MRIRLVLASALICGACAVAARAQDELGVFVEESAASAGPIEAPRLEVEGRTVFVRPFAEAFVDPDQRMNLEPKYYFPLALEEVASSPDHSSTLGRSPRDDIRPKWLATSVGPDRAQSWLSVAPPPASSRSATDFVPLLMPWNLRWLDYRSGREPERYRHVAFLASAGAGAFRVAEGQPPRLGVARVRWELSRVVIDRILAQRDVPLDESNPIVECLDTLDQPATSRPGAHLQGRVIAVFKQINGRHAVDFYSQSLHPDADRRLWLTPADASWGTPLYIKFHQVWVQKPHGPQLENVLAVVFASVSSFEPKVRCVAYDFPLARPLVLDNLRRLSAGAAKSNAKSKPSAPAVDVAQLLGEDLVDEYSRRLVDAVDR